MSDVRTAQPEDLDEVRAQYDAFVEDFSGVRPSTASAAFRLQTSLVHAWRRFPFLDPDLPGELLPADWPRRRAHELFSARHARWAPAARAWFEELEAGRSSRTAAAA